MEAKVDVRKLQVLNDRINQTIDALNQVRLSVHGLGHTGAPQLNPMTFLTSQGFPQAQGWGTPGIFGGGLGHTGMVPPQLLPYLYPQTQGFGGTTGLTGTPGFGQGIGSQGIFQGFGQQAFPGVGTGYGLQHSPFNPYVNPLINPLVSQGITPWGVGGGQATPDIEQRIMEARASDPIRITQTFPFAVI